MDEDKRRFAPATERNRAAILQVLEPLVVSGDLILEIGSGTGEHAAWMTPQLAGVEWQPTNPDPSLNESVAAWAAETDCFRILPPQILDATGVWPALPRTPALILSCNVIHISPFEVCRALFANGARILSPGMRLMLYGPFMRDGQHTAPSNQAFDQSLRAQNADWGVRDMADVEAEADTNGFVLEDVVEMPANNFSLIFQRSDA